MTTWKQVDYKPPPADDELLSDAETIQYRK